jgi:hypothetical protein
VIKAAGDGDVVFDGNGAYNLFNVMAANYNYFEGLTIRHTDLAFQAGLKNITGSSSDYNGFRPNEGAEFSFEWSSGPRP